jgi:tRNA modification GTPase
MPGERGLVSGELRLPEVAATLPADVYVMPGPRTYTGQDCVEIHTISSPPLVDHLITCLMSHGARGARPGEFTLRAFLNGKKDLTQAEAVQAVVEADSEAELKQALTQLAGGMTLPLHDLRDDLLNLLADIEAGLDFSEEDIQFVNQREMLLRLGKGLAQLINLQKRIDERGLSGRPFRVAFVGEPNAGKSSLFNTLIGTDAAIVSPVAGTTRDYVTQTIAAEGIHLELIDTAGWQIAETEIENQAQQLGHEQARQADLVVWCVEAVSWSSERGLPPAMWTESLVVLTKGDLSDITAEHPITSAQTGTGIAELKETLTARAKEALAPSIASSISRSRHHINQCLTHLRSAHHVVLFEEPAEMLALELRLALEQLGEMVGAIYTDDLLDRIFSRFCIGK